MYKIQFINMQNPNTLLPMGNAAAFHQIHIVQ